MISIKDCIRRMHRKAISFALQRSIKKALKKLVFDDMRGAAEFEAEEWI